MKSSPVKVSSPVIQNILVRERLSRRLDHAMKKRVVWVTGLPGSGKTTLVASYLASRRLSSAWYHIDGSDADPATLFYYLRYVVKNLTPSRRTRLPLLTPEYLASIITYARRYFENLFSMLPERFVLVFDNFHEINSSPVFHTIIREAAERIPEHRNIVLISRTDPPAAFIRMRANSEMEVIDNEALKFTTAEIRRLEHLHHRRGPGEKEIQELYNWTDGWAAGIVLLLGPYRVFEKPAARGGRIDRQAVFDYFSSEIFNRLDPAIQDFLLRTSFFPSMTIDMAVRMTGNDASGILLDRLIGYSYFTIRDRNSVFRYHDLFREFLLSRMQEVWTRKQLGDIRRHAAKILEDAGYIGDAITMFLESEDWTNAAGAILKHANTMVAQGRYQTLEPWLKRIPDRVSNDNPWLLYWLGACRLPFDPGRSFALFKQAFKLFTKKKDRNGIGMAWTGAVDSVTYGFGSYKLYDPWIRIMEKLAKKKGFPSGDAEIMATIKMFFAMIFRQHFNPRIKKWLKRVQMLLKNNTNIDFEIQLNTIIALYYLARGDVARGDTIMSPQRKLAYSKQVAPLTFLTFKSIDVLYNWNTAYQDPQFRTLYEGIKLAETTGVHVMDVMLSVFGAGWMLSTGHIQPGRQLLQKISGIIDRAGTYDRTLYYLVLTCEAMIREDFISAYDSQTKGLKLAGESGDVNLMILSTLQMSQILHELSEDRKALQYLKKAHAIGKEQKQFYFIYLIVRAIFAFDRNNERSGLHFLRQALQAGQENGYVNFIGWRPSVMARLCVKALEHGINGEYVRSLIRKRSLMPDTPPLECEDWPWPFQFYTLGSFRILKDGKSVELSRKAQARPLGLLQILIVHQDKGIEPDSIGRVLWPDTSGASAHRTLDTTLHRLRKLLGSHEAIVVQDGRLLLNQKLCWTDVAAFTYAVNTIDGLLNAKDHAARGRKIRDTANTVLQLYRGPFGAHVASSSWDMDFKENLHKRFILFIARLGMYYEQTGNIHEARTTYQKGLDIDDQVELFYQRLMALYKASGRSAEVVATYKRCADVLSQVLGTEPSEKTRELYRSIKREPGQ